jgi:hypothetical protein
VSYESERIWNRVSYESERIWNRVSYESERIWNRVSYESERIRHMRVDVQISTQWWSTRLLTAYALNSTHTCSADHSCPTAEDSANSASSRGGALQPCRRKRVCFSSLALKAVIAMQT